MPNAHKLVAFKSDKWLYILVSLKMSLKENSVYRLQYWNAVYKDSKRTLVQALSFARTFSRIKKQIT